jgi:hypothetical protein
MAARKKPARRRTRRFKGLNVPQAIIGYAGATIWSEALLGVSPIEFVMSDKGSGGSNKINLKELIDSLTGGRGGVAANWGGPETNALQMIQRNAKASWIDAALQSVTLGVGSTVILKLTKKPRAALNRTVRNFGLGDVVKF